MKSSIVVADKSISVSDIQAADVLDVRNVDAQALNELTTHCVARALRLYHVLISTLDGVERLRSTRSLEIVWANKIEDLAPVFRMKHLERLILSDFPRLKTLDGIEALENLGELDLSGNSGSLQPPLRLASLKPLAMLKKLVKLSIFNVRLEDADISFLASAFPYLRSLKIWNHNIDRAQVAFIAGKLNPQLQQPITAHRKVGVCQKCGGSLYRFVGYRMPMVCERCNEKRFRRLVDEFERLMTSA